MKSGFTLIELLIALVIIALAAAIILWSLGAFASRQAAANAAAEIVSALNLARSQTLNGLADNVHGVHFTSTSFSLFTGSSFNPSDPGNLTTPLSGATLATTLAGGVTSVIFNRLTGATANTGTITITTVSGQTVINVLSSGLVTVN